MSNCISREGEYSDHKPDKDFCCTRCFALDETGLLARVRELEDERDAALAAVEVTRKLHHKITRYGNEDYSIEAEHFEEDPESYPDLRAFDLCAECYEVERLICEECGGDAPIGHRSNWPCPTVAALDGVPEPEENL